MDGIQAVAPGLSLSKILSDVGAEFRRLGVQGQMEMASALFNGNAFVPYGPGQYTPTPEQAADHGLPIEAMQQPRGLLASVGSVGGSQIPARSNVLAHLRPCSMVLDFQRADVGKMHQRVQQTTTCFLCSSIGFRKQGFTTDFAIWLNGWILNQSLTGRAIRLAVPQTLEARGPA